MPKNIQRLTSPIRPPGEVDLQEPPGRPEAQSKPAPIGPTNTETTHSKMDQNTENGNPPWAPYGRDYLKQNTLLGTTKSEMTIIVTPPASPIPRHPNSSPSLQLQNVLERLSNSEIEDINWDIASETGNSHPNYVTFSEVPITGLPDDMEHATAVEALQITQQKVQDDPRHQHSYQGTNFDMLDVPSTQHTPQGKPSFP